MKTRVLTTNPAGHVVTLHDGDLTPCQVRDIYKEFYDTVITWTTNDTIPPITYIRCIKKGREPELYTIKRS